MTRGIELEKMTELEISGITGPLSVNFQGYTPIKYQLLYPHIAGIGTTLTMCPPAEPDLPICL
jgi:hypothetical protein